VTYRIDFDSMHRILRCRLEGRVTDEELREYYRLAGDHVAQTEPVAGILDLTAVKSFEVSSATIRELAKSRSPFPHPEHPRIVIATSSDIFGLARMFEIEGHEKRPNLHVVRSQKEALAILGIQKAKFSPMQIK
jgi:hypothetical protein